MIVAALLLQSVSQPAATPPDIELNVRAQVREVRIERQGEASLEVSGPDSVVRVEAPRAEGRRRLRNVTVAVDAEARIADPRQNREAPETPGPD